MTDLVASEMRGKVARLQAEMLMLPQLEMPTEHFFVEGVYVRTVAFRKDELAVGKVHKREHLFIVMSGCLRITTDEGVRDVRAPSVIVSGPNTKRAALALEDSVCMTVHRTDKTDLDEIEAELIEPDALAAFDSWNKLKELT